MPATGAARCPGTRLEASARWRPPRHRPSRSSLRTAGDEFGQPGPELVAEVGALHGELHDRLQVTERHTGVVPGTAVDDAVYRRPVREKLCHRVGELDFAA